MHSLFPRWLRLDGSLKGTRILQSLSLKLSLHPIIILLQYPLEMFVVLTDGFKVYTIGLQSALDRNYVKKKNCFHFSVKDLINFVKNSKDNYGTYVGLVNLRAIFPVKKSFMQHPRFLLHKRHFGEHLRKS